MEKTKEEEEGMEGGRRITTTIVKATAQAKHDFGGHGTWMRNKMITLKRLPQRIDNACPIAVRMCKSTATLLFKVHKWLCSIAEDLKHLFFSGV